MYSISKDFHFSASHVLYGLQEGHPCGRVHGHNYIVRVSLEAPVLDAVGFILDFHDLSLLGDYLDEELDHRHLNDQLTFQPTAENLAAHLFACCSAWSWPVKKVGVSETPKTWAYFTAPEGA